MENTAHLELSDYQRAILNEMGISSWLLTDKQQTQVKTESQASEAIVSSSEVMTTEVAKEHALAKLKQFKVPIQTTEATEATQATETTNSVLVTFSPSDTKFQIFTDVLIALGLEATPQQSISNAQLSHYIDYPLSWTQGAQVSLNQKQLITPALAELQHPDTKKQLWQQLQSAYTLQNSN